MSSPFCYKPHGHIITGDMNIITNPKLRQLFQFGPKYREPPKENRNFNFKLIMDAAEAHISRLRSSHTVINTTSDFDDPSVWECLDALHDKYVVVPADKASNNIIFVCKQYYIQCLKNELQINSDDESNTTYSLSTLSEEEILQNHATVLSEFGIK